MSTTFRVDRSDNPRYVPCGMNSLLYVGDSLRKARRIFTSARPGLTPWNKPNNAYGIILSHWDNHSKTYIVRQTKGFGQEAFQ